ncbi:hypothetical protein QDY71_01715 [Kingella negevensis]|uniref:Uncharacterized protein n=1 Tax=Kingella negevensis TaxID=1522312 RepID=A0A238HFF9_9NEIS|nr:hypothetical protein [Kingella negevensis]MDK4680192.1 hypothetical protein [Kingella negevensis]MDK4682088.1 hypothetical protein [Kingella negevensis]MDK4690284.1 hypothetical protein [Kingella negevensis]MDK4692370.1 hypothetical protein [Kingella negevensis]MDK4696509.1 hypothetical protein [Kingella negevensis]
MTLTEYLFHDLKNLNDGFDSPQIYYVSEQDFETVLDRAQAENIDIYGIEPWLDGEFYGVEVYESTEFAANDPRWYRTAFDNFRKQQSDLMYAMTYGYSD